MRWFPTVLLVLDGLGFLGFGIWLVAEPLGPLASVGVGAVAPAGVVELRAFYGGLEVGLGLFLLACAARGPWRVPGLWLVLLSNGGIGLVRLAALVGGGAYVPFFGASLAWELGFAALAAWALVVERRSAG